MTVSMPTLFVPHGAPTVALDPGSTGEALARVCARLERPRAVVIVSPHWAMPQPTVGCADALETIHDFHGFPDALHALRYPAHGDPDCAGAVRDAIAQAGLGPVVMDPVRGLDHGAWIPLRMMFPDADVPVVPVSLQSREGVEGAWRLGRALAPLTRAGFLIVGSGNLTHNLQDWRRVATMGAPVPAYVQAFPEWIAQRLAAHDLEALRDYRRRAPGGALAHPSDEHLQPLYVALGAAGEAPRAERFHAGVNDGVIAMDGWAFHRTEVGSRSTAGPH
jgi:4,5-DOPA dioxygenase extradiol